MHPVRMTPSTTAMVMRVGINDGSQSFMSRLSPQLPTSCHTHRAEHLRAPSAPESARPLPCAAPQRLTVHDARPNPTRCGHLASLRQGSESLYEVLAPAPSGLQ